MKYKRGLYIFFYFLFLDGLSHIMSFFTTHSNISLSPLFIKAKQFVTFILLKVKLFTSSPLFRNIANLHAIKYIILICLRIHKVLNNTKIARKNFLENSCYSFIFANEKIYLQKYLIIYALSTHYSECTVKDGYG